MSTVPLASGYLKRLVETERLSSGSGMKDAIKSVARRLRCTPGTAWNIMFRPPKDIGHSLYCAIEAAVEKKIRHEIEELQNELAQLAAGRRRLAPGVVEEVEASLVRLRASLREDT